MLTEVYKLNSLEAKENETEISEELFQLSYHAHIFFLGNPNSCLKSLDFISTKDVWREEVAVESHSMGEVCWLSKPGS